MNSVLSEWTLVGPTGEKQERIDELSDDLNEMKQTYRQQIEFMAEEIMRLQQAQQQQRQEKKE